MSSPEQLLREGFPQLEAMVSQGKRRELNAGGLALLSLALSGAFDTAHACRGTFRRLYTLKLQKLMDEIEVQGKQCRVTGG